MATRKAVTWLFVAFAAWYWQKYIIRGPVFEDMKDFTGKTVLITGRLSHGAEILHLQKLSCLS